MIALYRLKESEMRERRRLGPQPAGLNRKCQKMNFASVWRFYLSEFWVEAAVDDWIVGRMRHGQPMASESHKVDFAPRPNGRVLISDDLYKPSIHHPPKSIILFVPFITSRFVWLAYSRNIIRKTYLQKVERKPAEGEEEDDDNHHFDHL